NLAAQSRQRNNFSASETNIAPWLTPTPHDWQLPLPPCCQHDRWAEGVTCALLLSAELARRCRVASSGCRVAAGFRSSTRLRSREVATSITPPLQGLAF